MKIGLVSDTHQNHDTIFSLVSIFEEINPDILIHLGDDYIDGEGFIESRIKLIRIPGTWCPQYEDPLIENRRIETLNNWRLFLSHTPTPHYKDTPQDINPQQVIKNEGCDLFLHGHTHRPAIEERDHFIRINPGHNNPRDKRGFEPSYGLLTLEEDEAHMAIYYTDTQDLLMEKTFKKPSA